MPCIEINQAWKIMMKDHEYDHVELKRSQLEENLTSIKKVKNSMCKFGSLVMFLLFYVHNHFLKYFLGVR